MCTNDVLIDISCGCNDTSVPPRWVGEQLCQYHTQLSLKFFSQTLVWVGHVYP